MNHHHIILEAGRADRQYWRDLWAFRELLLQLTRRGVSVQYKQTFVGGAWALIRPLMTVVIFTVVFSKIAKLDAPVWYPLFVLTAMLPWQLFASILSESSNSLVSNANLISKVYFPRLIVPLSTTGIAFVDLCVVFPVAALMMAYVGLVPPVQIVLLPVFLLLAAITAIGFGLGLCALNVKFRDVRYILPFVVQVGTFLSPIGYSTDYVAKDEPAELHVIYQLLYHLNPMVFVIDGVRWSLLGVGNPFSGGGWIVSLSVITVALIVGVRYFRATEKTFADVI